MPDEQRTGEQQTISVSLKVPSTAWTVQIEEIYQANEELWIISRLRSSGFGGQTITEVSDEVTVEVPDLPEKHIVLGKTWNWENEEEYQFSEEQPEIEDPLQDGTRLWKRED